MRRYLAIAMVFLFGFPMAAPLFAGDAASGLPACCRRGGTHHCANAVLAGSGSRSISTLAPRCPNWPKSTPAPRPTDLAYPITQSIGAPLYAHPASAPQTAARYRVACARSRQKRGPPAVLS